MGQIELNAGPTFTMTTTTTTASSPTIPTTTAHHYRGVSASAHHPPRPIVHFSTAEPSTTSSETNSLSMESRLRAHPTVRDMRERIKGMKKWRKELERSVFWHREELWRVERAMGRKKEMREREEEGEGCVMDGGGGGVVGRVLGDEGWGVGGKTWERGR